MAFNLVDIAPILDSIKLYGMIGIIIFVMGIITIFFVYYRKFNIKVFIAKYYAENRFIWRTDSAKKTRTKEGIEEFKLFKANRKFSPPTVIHRLQSTFFPKDFIFLREDVYGDLHEMSVSHELKGIKPIPHDLMIWKINEANKAWEAYKATDGGWLAKYGPTIATMAGFAILFVMVIIILYYMKDVSAAFENAAGSLADATRSSPLPSPPG